MRDNYAQMREAARQRFLTAALDEGCLRLGLAAEPEGVTLPMPGGFCFVRRSDGAVFDGKAEADFALAMTAYDLLGRSGEAPRLSGRFVPTAELHGIMGSNSVHEDLRKNDGAWFSGKTQALRAACRALGGVPGQKGDVSFVLTAFGCFPAELRFWEADEEFPALLQWFWDGNALQFLRYETLWYLSADLLRRVRSETERHLLP